MSQMTTVTANKTHNNSKHINYSNNLLEKSIKKTNNTSIKTSNKTCNLIGKMINDVSKTPTKTATAMAISDLRQTPRDKATETITITTAEIAEHANGEGGGNRLNEDDEFPYAEKDASATVTATTTHTCAINKADDSECKQTNSPEVAQESSCCRLSSTSALLTPTTPLDDARHDNSTSGSLNRKTTTKPKQYAKEQYVRGEPTTPISSSWPLSSKAAAATTTTTLTVKPSVLLQNQATTLTHKNITNVPCEASYHRTLETETSTINCRKAHQCELLETSTTFVNKQQSQAEKIQSLAERKALLKKEFFKDFPSSNTDNTTKPALSKRLLKKQHNLKLKIPQKPGKNLQNNQEPETVAEPQTNQASLVALRKLDLQRKTVQLSSKPPPDSTKVFDSAAAFPSVKELAKKFDYSPKMIVPQTKLNADSDMVSLKPDALDQRNSPLSDEGCNLGQSPYSSDDDNDSIRTTHTAIERLPSKRKDKVARSASSDSALGLEVDESMDTSEPTMPQQQQKRRMTLTVTDLPLRPALLPLAEPTLLPDSPTLELLPNQSLNQTQIPSKVLLEERVVEILEDPRSGGSSRRESSQSCLSDYPAGDMQGVRFVRTPSVVVSDYSDDIMCGITLEEIEYFRAQRMRRRRSSLDTSGTEKDALDNNSDVSAASSCSNLYYCGSTISALDGAECLVNGMRMQLERKTSDCSTCSVSGDEDTAPNFTIPEQPEDCQDLSDMLANQHLSCKRSKKVGGITTGLLTVDNTNFP